MNNKHKLMEQKRGEIISGKKAKLEKGLKFNEVIYEHKSGVFFVKMGKISNMEFFCYMNI